MNQILKHNILSYILKKYPCFRNKAILNAIVNCITYKITNSHIDYTKFELSMKNLKCAFLAKSIEKCDSKDCNNNKNCDDNKKCNNSAETTHKNVNEIRDALFKKYNMDITNNNKKNMCNDKYNSYNDKYKSCIERYKTFEDWVGNVDPLLLARAGFYLVNKQSDNVKCFSCGICFKDWMDHHDPQAEHYKWNTNCEFMNSIYLPQSVIDDAQK